MINVSDQKNPKFSTKVELLTEENFDQAYLRFENRQAGVGLVYCNEEQKYYYNAYCLEMSLLKELMAVEFEFLDDALEFINQEFSSWELVHYDKKKGCSDCAAK